jgi:glutamine---fructose-6-phosphate transaminase (isomerizing)
MCGIFGIITSKQSNYTKEFLSKSLKQLAFLSESRGKDSSGLCSFNQIENRIDIIKGPIPIKKLLKTQELKNNLFSAFSNGTSAKYAFGHARLVTNGTQLNDSNNQPVIKDGVIGVHNGIVVNVDELWEKHTNIKRENEIDTEVLLALVRSEIDINKSVEEAVKSSVEKVIGTVSVALVLDNLNKFVLCTNNGSLYMIHNNRDILFFASESFMLKEFEKKANLSQIGEYKFEQIASNYLSMVDLENFSVKNVSFKNNTSRTKEDTKNFKYPISSSSIQSAKDQVSIIVDINQIHINPNAGREQSLLQYNIEKIKNIKRCTKCVLPETFPFIEFNEDGECNYCRNYQSKRRPSNLGDLEKLVDKYRRSDNQPDCIVPFSGGRDSTFSLHVIKKELKMNPIAYTYDWGMVTDLARRNIARVCGKLGVENIIVAANLNEKRRNIRINLNAWLKAPSLGMIPLFMVGDKAFHYYLLNIKKQTGLKLNIWGENYLENTDFKVGFNGVPPQFDKEKLYKISFGRQLKLYESLMKEVVKNPSYINISNFDSIKSFASRQYFKKADYYNFFDFYEWNENQLENLILSEYDWEIAKDSKSTWRIGDGTAAFYNYIYYTVAGFSEHDTFRSNQIREGMINREQGLKLLENSNVLRYETIKWYLNIIGVNYETTIKRINEIPKFYH